jgi:Uma2 family endonuclease
VIKMRTYAQYGINEYWIVDSITRTLEQYQLVDSGLYELHNLFEDNDKVTSDKLPCVSFVIGDMFRETPN